MGKGGHVNHIGGEDGHLSARRASMRDANPVVVLRASMLTRALQAAESGGELTFQSCIVVLIQSDRHVSSTAFFAATCCSWNGG